MIKKTFHSRRGRGINELMVIIIIFAILLLVVYPAIRGAIMHSNEMVAVRTLKSLSNALELYKNDKQDYPETPLDLISLNPPYFLNVRLMRDIELNKKGFSGYYFNYEKDKEYQYIYVAYPTKKGVTGKKQYIVDETAEVKEYIPPGQYYGD